MAKIDVYDSSKLATFISALGWIGLGFGSYACFNEELGFDIGIIALAISFALKMLAFIINKIKEKWDAKKREAKKKQDK